MPPDLAPHAWPYAERIAAEHAEGTPWPTHARAVSSRTSLVAATMSPLSVLAGLQALRAGGSAADAVTVTALTQIVAALGSYVSFAGTLQLLHFSAATGRIDSLNAGWNTWSAETDPASIPVCDLAPLPFHKSATSGAEGRKTLVPGFMAGLAAMHQRLGRLPWATLFQPAIAYADHGIVLSPMLLSYFPARGKYLARTAEGRAFLHQCGHDSPSAGDRFRQTSLAHTLRAVAEQGAAYMYSGDWGRQYVAAIQREGGCASLDDMDRYRPTWEEPLTTTFCGATVAVPGACVHSAARILQALNLAAALGLAQAPPYFQDPQSLRTLTRILHVTALDTLNPPSWRDWKRRHQLDPDHLSAPCDHAAPAYAGALAAALASTPPDTPQAIPPPSPPAHSDAIVAIDAEGNIAALVHTINTLPWGSTGIVVGGIPVSDAAGFQQSAIAAAGPGARLPTGMAPLLALRENRPVLALAAIGASLVPETLRLALGVLAHHLDLRTLLAAPAVFESEPPPPGAPITETTLALPDGVYPPAFLDRLEAGHVPFVLRSRQETALTKGTAAVATLTHDDTGQPTLAAAETPGVFAFAAGL